MAKENGIDCPVYGPGSVVRIGDWSYEYGTPVLAKPENRLPWISNVNERGTFSREGVMALVVPVKWRNESPIKGSSPIRRQFRTSDGEKRSYLPYNAKLWISSRGLEVAESSTSPPGKWMEDIAVHNVDPEYAAGSAYYLYETETRRDERGRKYEVTIRQAVVELADPIVGDPINPDHDKSPPAGTAGGRPAKKGR